MQRNEKILEILRSTEVLAFVSAHLSADIRTLALQFGGKTTFSLPPVLEWIDALQRAEKKVPAHYEAMCFFTRRSLEQASSEATAMYKASCIKGENLLNLSGGLGIDDWAFAQRNISVISLDPNEGLNELVRANSDKMNLNLVQRLDITAEEYLQSTRESFSWIYADPDRRDEGKRLVILDDCVPAVKGLWQKIQERSERQVLKLSPLYPLELLEKEIKGLIRIEVVAVHGEVKEVLAFSKTKDSGGPAIRKAVELDGLQSFEGFPIAQVSGRFASEAYFYEVHPSLSKTNLAGTYADHLGTKSLIPNSIYQVSDTLIPDYFGRGFQVIEQGNYSKKLFQQYLNKLKIAKANVACRYFKLTPEEIKKAHRLQDGGEHYFILYTDVDGKAAFIHGRKFG